MANSKKGKIAQMLSPENYIRQKARTLPIYKCLVNSDWRQGDFANILVARRHTNGNITAAIYLADLLCLGVKDTYFIFNRPEQELDEIIQKNYQQGMIKTIDYALAHNIILSAIEFAGDYGFAPYKDYTSVTQYILEEDTDEIELMDIECGSNGKPLYVRSPFDSDAMANRIIKQLQLSVGPDGFEYYNEDEDDDFDEEDVDYDDTADFGTAFTQEEIETYKQLDNRMESLNEKELKKYIELNDQFFDHMIAEDLAGEYYDEFFESWSLNVNDEITEEVLGVEQTDYKKLADLRAELPGVIDILAKNQKKARKKVDALINDYPEIPFLAFLDLYLKRYEGEAEYLKKLAEYSQKYPDYPLLRINQLNEYYRNYEADRDKLPSLFPDLSAFYQGRESIHSLEFSEFLIHSLFYFVKEANPARIAAFADATDDLELDETTTTKLNALLFFAKKAMVEVALKDYENTFKDNL